MKKIASPLLLLLVVGALLYLLLSYTYGPRAVAPHPPPSPRHTRRQPHGGGTAALASRRPRAPADGDARGATVLADSAPMMAEATRTQTDDPFQWSADDCASQMVAPSMHGAKVGANVNPRQHAQSDTPLVFSRNVGVDTISFRCGPKPPMPTCTDASQIVFNGSDALTMACAR